MEAHAYESGSFNYFSVGLIGLVGLFVLALLIGVVFLIANRSTRTAGIIALIVLAACGGLVALVVGGLAFSYHSVSSQDSGSFSIEAQSGSSSADLHFGTAAQPRVAENWMMYAKFSMILIVPVVLVLVGILVALVSSQKTRGPTLSVLSALGLLVAGGGVLVVFLILPSTRDQSSRGANRLVVDDIRRMPEAPSPSDSAPRMTTTAEAPLPSPSDQPPPADRPAWVDEPARLEGLVYRDTAHSGLFSTAAECDAALADATRKKVAHYIEICLSDEAARSIALEPQYVQQHIQRARYVESVNSSVGPMQQVYAQLQFDDNVRAEINRRWHQILVAARLWCTGAASALVLVLIGTLFGYLKVDLATRGAYRHRLKFAAAAVILATSLAAIAVRNVVPF